MQVLGIFTAFGLSASAGLNAYIPLLVIALLARFTNLITLSQPWDALRSWWIIGLLVVLNIVEFLADKVPAVNHINDTVQTFVRPIAGAIVFAASAGTFSEIHPILAMGCGLIVAGGIHTVKSAVVRPAVSTVTAGTGNVPVSIAEDFTSTVISILSVVVPVVVASLIVLVVAWLIFRMYRRTRLQQP